MKIIKNKYTIEQMAETRWFLSFTDKNDKGETLAIELSKCIDDATWKNSLPKIWKRNGYTDGVLTTYWSVSTYIKDSEGNGFGSYNPQHIGACDINFAWMLETTEENKEKLINEVYKLFLDATGKTATDRKIERVYKVAKDRGIEVVTNIPEGWLKADYATDPCGAQSVCNMKMNLQALHDGTFQRKLLLI